MGNHYINETYKRIREKHVSDGSSMSMGEYICKNTTLGGKPFSFSKFPFQEAIANDMHPKLCCIKISQIGLTEVETRKAACFAKRYRRTSVIFTLPNKDIFKQVAQSRMLPLVEREPIFNLHEGSKVRNVNLLEIDESFVHMVIANEAAATSTPADVVFNDEQDLSDQKMLALFNSRMQASDWKINQRFSTPTYSNFGIDAEYKVSDQHVRIAKCYRCQHHFVPDFDHDHVIVPGLNDQVKELTDTTKGLCIQNAIDLTAGYTVCPRCRQPINYKDCKWEWIATYPSRTLNRGYRINCFTDGVLSPLYIFDQIFEYRKADNIRGLFNTVLGRTYDSGNTRIQYAHILACFTDDTQPKYIREPGYIYGIGIDIGATCHIVIGRIPLNGSLACIEIIAFETVLSDHIETRIQELDTIFLFNTGGGDRYPYTPTMNAIRDLTHGRIQPFEYRGKEEIKDQSETYGHVQANRTRQLDDVALYIRTNRYKFTGYGDQRDTIITHFQDMVREESPEKEATWKKLTNNDHYFHATGFLHGAFKLYTGDFDKDQTKEEKRSCIMIASADVNIGQNDIYGNPLKKPLGRVQSGGAYALGFGR